MESMSRVSPGFGACPSSLPKCSASEGRPRLPAKSSVRRFPPAPPRVTSAGDEEISEQVAGPAPAAAACRRRSDRAPAAFFGRRQQVDIVALANRLGLGRRQDTLLAHHQGGPRPGRNQTAPADRDCWGRADSRRSPAPAVRADRARPGAAADHGAAARCEGGAPAQAMVQPCTRSETSTTTQIRHRRKAAPWASSHHQGN